MNITKEDLIRLAQELGLPCIERENSITVMGEIQILVFNLEDIEQCQTY